MGGCLRTKNVRKTKQNKTKSFSKPTAIFWCLMPNPGKGREVKTARKV